MTRRLAVPHRALVGTPGLGLVAQRDALELHTRGRRHPVPSSDRPRLHYFGGYTIAETARILGMHEGTAKKHLNRGLGNLRESQGLRAEPRLPAFPGSDQSAIRSARALPQRGTPRRVATAPPTNCSPSSKRSDYADSFRAFTAAARPAAARVGTTRCSAQSRLCRRRHNLDNGSAFVDAWLLRGCAVLGIKLIHSRPGNPREEGK